MESLRFVETTLPVLFLFDKLLLNRPTRLIEPSGLISYQELVKDIQIGNITNNSVVPVHQTIYGPQIPYGSVTTVIYRNGDQYLIRRVG